MDYEQFIKHDEKPSSFLAAASFAASLHDKQATEGIILHSIERARSYEEAIDALMALGTDDKKRKAARELIVALSALKREAIPYDDVRTCAFLKSRFYTWYIRFENDQIYVSQFFGALPLRRKEDARRLADIGNALLYADRAFGGSPMYDVCFEDKTLAVFSNRGLAEAFGVIVEKTLASQ